MIPIFSIVRDNNSASIILESDLKDVPCSFSSYLVQERHIQDYTGCTDPRAFIVILEMIPDRQHIKFLSRLDTIVPVVLMDLGLLYVSLCDVFYIH